MVKLKRVYDPVSADDGKRVLIDRLWPRGLTKEEAHIDEWMKEIAPSTNLRTWFSHDPAKWQEFRKRYRKELQDHAPVLEKLRKEAEKSTVTIVFASRDVEHANAVVLKELLEESGRKSSKKG
jgi:uncharacterized protein YeaO (DUF488 family)